MMLGSNGRNSDAVVHASVAMSSAVQNNTLNIPTHTLVGDEAIPLKPHIS